MARTKATAGFVVYPKKPRKDLRAPGSRSRRKPWVQSTSTQAFSPLFTQIATEIRSMIYNYAFSICDTQFFVELQSPANNIPDSSQHSGRGQQQIYRPPPERRGYEQKHVLALLQTCQAVYKEARELAVSVNTHVLLYPPISVLSFPIPTEARTYFSRMPGNLIEHASHVHLFVGADRFRTFYNMGKKTAGYRSETPFAELALLRNGNGSIGQFAKLPYQPIHPTTLTITVRDYEWTRYSFEGISDEALMLADRFLHNQKWETVFGSLQHLIMELEIEVNYTEQLERQVRGLMGFEFDVGANRKLVSRPAYDKAYWKRNLTSREQEAIVARERYLRETGAGVLGETTSHDTFKELVVFTVKWDLVIQEAQQPVS